MQNNCESIATVRENTETTNACSKWTQKEELQLIKSITNGNDIGEIAKEHKRTRGAIKSRILHIAMNMVDDGKQIQNVCTLLCLTHIEVENAHKHHLLKRMNTKNTTQDKNQETQLDILRDIRDILVRIEANLLAE